MNRPVHFEIHAGDPLGVASVDDAPAKAIAAGADIPGLHQADMAAR